MTYSATCFNLNRSSSGYLKHIKEVCVSYFARQISLLTSFVTIQFLYLQLGTKFATTIKIKLKLKNLLNYENSQVLVVDFMKIYWQRWYRDFILSEEKDVKF